jgi:hypothetical protein
VHLFFTIADFVRLIFFFVQSRVLSQVLGSVWASSVHIYSVGFMSETRWDATHTKFKCCEFFVVIM